MKRTTIALITLLGVGLAGCGNSSNGGVPPAITLNSLQEIVASAANSDPTSPGDRAQLVADIEALFGTTAADPVDVLAGETVGELITRLGG